MCYLYHRNADYFEKVYIGKNVISLFVCGGESACVLYAKFLHMISVILLVFLKLSFIYYTLKIRSKHGYSVHQCKVNIIRFYHKLFMTSPPEIHTPND